MSQSYLIKPKSELKGLIDKIGLQEYFQRKDNKAFVYQLCDEKYILLPITGSKGLLFDNKGEYELTLKDGIIPLTDETNFFEKNQYLIRQIPDSNDRFIEKLEDSLHIHLKFNDFTDEYFNSLSEKIEIYGRKKASQDLYFEFGIYIGEIIRKRRNGDWKLDVEYGINKYFEPRLYTSDKVHYPWENLGKYFSSRGHFPFDMILKSSLLGYSYEHDSLRK